MNHDYLKGPPPPPFLATALDSPIFEKSLPRVLSNSNAIVVRNSMQRRKRRETHWTRERRKPVSAEKPEKRTQVFCALGYLVRKC